MKPLMTSSLLGAFLLGLVLLQTGYSDDKAAADKKADSAVKRSFFLSNLTFFDLRRSKSVK